MTYKSGIYGFRCSESGKWYVGQSLDAKGRKYSHLYSLRKGTHGNSHLQYAFNKYGEDSFEFQILEIVPVEMLDVREKAWITYYRSTNRDFGYNIYEGGSVNRNLPKETRDKISSAKKGVRLSQETRERISRAGRGRTHSAETRAKMSRSMRGLRHRPMSPDARARIGETQRGKYVSPETRARMSVARMGAVVSPETRAKLSAINIGKKASPEQRAKLSEAQTARWAKIKNAALEVTA